ncbi:hypothetical protein [Moheibacter stercoris]|uniref:Outer membrane protein beta-barrel domain-containing protein n=1 Tax=Moheibacter stercoris TaxID=1628251 RepID=A0ABV2LQR5_9FLAO
MKKILTFLFLLSIGFINAQEKGGLMSHLLINVGYSNLNGNYFKLGPEVYLVQPNDNLIDLSATANMAYFKDKFVVVPELGIGYQFNAQKVKNRIDPYREYMNGTFYSARVNVSPWNVTPEIGIALIGIVEANVGYSFQFRDHKYTSFEGIKFGLTIHIPTIFLVSEAGLY